MRQAQRSQIAALQRFAQRLRGYRHGIPAHCRHPLDIRIVHGINNTAKVIKCQISGYRGEEYLFFKIRAEPPVVLNGPISCRRG